MHAVDARNDSSRIWMGFIGVAGTADVAEVAVAVSAGVANALSVSELPAACLLFIGVSCRKVSEHVLLSGAFCFGKKHRQ